MCFVTRKANVLHNIDLSHKVDVSYNIDRFLT